MTPTPESLRARADAADVAGDETTAEALRNEADDLEQNPPATGGEVPQ